MTVLAPGDTLGILGGGQLGRMLAMAAAELGLRTHLYAPEAGSPAFAVAAAHTVAGYDDGEALDRFAAAVDLVTFEFENIPVATLERLAARGTVRPGPRSLALTQDRLHEKTFVRSLGLQTAPFADLDEAGGPAAAAAGTGLPAILKTRRFGYDGKGQVRVSDPAEAAGADRTVGRPSILEGVVPFEREVSVVAARAVDGTVRAYDVCENVHEHGILATTAVPAALAAPAAAAALDIAGRIAAALDHVGVLAVELFAVAEAGAPGGVRLLVNEIAPRVHNSGHWTLGGAVTSQFAQHVRAVAGWPLGDTRRLGAIAMRNLIGDAADRWPTILAEDGASLHLYGKAEARPGRKMGHVTTVRPDPA